MKKTLYSLSIVFFAFAMFVTSTAQAHDHDKDHNPPPPSRSNTPLPINNGIALLTIAGVIIGITAIKKAKTATIKA